MASVLYGALFGGLSTIFTRLAPQPAGAILFWSFVSLQLAWFALVCWRRTRLPFITSGMINGSVLSAGLVILGFMGQPFPRLAPSSWVLFGAAATIGPVLLFIESRVNPEKWREWQRHMEHMTLWHILIVLRQCSKAWACLWSSAVIRTCSSIESSPASGWSTPAA